MRAYVISLFMLAAIPSTLSAQSAPPDVLSALLGEVRQLRSVMERVVTTAPRIQLSCCRAGGTWSSDIAILPRAA